MKDDLILFGRIVKTSKENGNLFIRPFEEIEYKNIDFLFVEIDGTYIPFKINEIKIKKKNSLEIKFEFINNTKENAEIVSKNVFIEKKFCTFKEENKNGIIGYIVIDEDLSKLGEIVNVINNNIQKLLEIRENNSTKSFLIPYVNEFIFNIDHSKKTIYVRNTWKIIR
jgi:16S rRNA processing protein RimM